MDLDIYCLNFDGPGRERGMVIHVAPAGQVVGRAMCPPSVVKFTIKDSKAEHFTPQFEAPHERGKVCLRSRYAFDLDKIEHNARLTEEEALALRTDRTTVALVVAELGGKLGDYNGDPGR